MDECGVVEVKLWMDGVRQGEECCRLFLCVCVDEINECRKVDAR